MAKLTIFITYKTSYIHTAENNSINNDIESNVTVDMIDRSNIPCRFYIYTSFNRYSLTTLYEQPILSV